MLTSEIRINGAMLGHLYMVNLQVREGNNVLYEVEYYRTGKGHVKTTLMHNPDDGPEVLTIKAFKAIMKTKAYKEMMNGS